MKISYNWLKDYLKCDLSAAQTADALTSIGLEVDSVEQVESVPGGLAGVIVAEVVECYDHPDSDHLHITKLNTGEGGLLQVVCGAPNVAAGQKVLLATVGTVLGGDFKIKKSRIRGVDSFGMICAEDELGIGTSHDGIMVLDPSAVPGTPARDYLHLETDWVIEIGLTANRIDAASHIGVARDLYAWLRLHEIPCSLGLPDVSAFKEGPEGVCSSSEVIDGAIPVEVLAPDGAPRYSGITIKGVKVAPSPQWLQKKLLSVGLRPINNVVDITNFVLMETGQPLHAFDAGKITGNKVIVRRAAEGEKFVTLDGVERTLSSEDLMIANTREAMCIAGVFGGEESGVTETTTDVFIESCESVGYQPFDALKDIQSIGSGRFKFVVAGLRNIVRFKREVALGNNSVLTHLESLTVKPFKSMEARELLEVPLSYLGFRFPKDNDTEVLISTIFGTTNYFPGLLQLYCAKLIEAMRRDYAGYSESETPPYIVKKDHIKKVLAEQSLQQDIREKFFITLKVGEDDYYYIIALLVAYHYHGNKSQNGCSASDLIELADTYSVGKISTLKYRHEYP